MFTIKYIIKKLYNYYYSLNYLTIKLNFIFAIIINESIKNKLKILTIITNTKTK